MIVVLPPKRHEMADYWEVFMDIGKKNSARSLREEAAEYAGKEAGHDHGLRLYPGQHQGAK